MKNHSTAYISSPTPTPTPDPTRLPDPAPSPPAHTPTSDIVHVLMSKYKSDSTMLRKLRRAARAAATGAVAGVVSTIEEVRINGFAISAVPSGITIRWVGQDDTKR